VVGTPCLFNDSLVAKADAEDRDSSLRECDQPQAAAGVLRLSWAGREDDHRFSLQCDLKGLGCGNAVTKRLSGAAKSLEALDQVEREAVEIVDQKDFALAHCPWLRLAAARIERSADALRLVSS